MLHGIRAYGERLVTQLYVRYEDRPHRHSSRCACSCGVSVRGLTHISPWRAVPFFSVLVVELYAAGGMGW